MSTTPMICMPIYKVFQLMIEDASVSPDEIPDTNLFVLADERTFGFQQPFQKILGFCPMFNGSCVVLAIKTHRVECVVHVDHAGKIIKEHTLNNSNICSYAVTSDREMVWLSVC